MSDAFERRERLSAYSGERGSMVPLLSGAMSSDRPSARFAAAKSSAG
jgi:hypothetical protein